MTVVEICCPNCGSYAIKKAGTDYCCTECGRYFRVITSSKKVPNFIIEKDQSIKFGKLTFNFNNIKTLGNFKLKNEYLDYYLINVFKFHVLKQFKRGDTIVKADIHGYCYVDPANGKVTKVDYSESGQYPKATNTKIMNLHRECIRILVDKAFENKPSVANYKLSTEDILNAEKVHNVVFDWLISDFVFKKPYTIKSAQGYDSGVREAIFTFKQKNILQFGSVGIYAVPIFHLYFKHPKSQKVYNRNYLGYSCDLIRNELNCSTCSSEENHFPENVCNTCENLICEEHTILCEKCGVALCKKCAKSKGIISKHHYCSSCA